ncbi:hypothetical protein PPSIR1_22866 [Plesiocystis pacifica SIR-1]|uniref:Uncharacterized protein n=1 Tax=Plesiocystis pacifica SIR-1 TaxID=391625 RepID=A6G2J6_9BACT|nr:hypothetical protein [Plesiocystis pacifica]EDM79933.1 hypothetical protein PPSIR1_22866 [Plesiocystis pacifica SIR-1]
MKVGSTARHIASIDRPSCACRKGGIRVVVASPTPMIGTLLEAITVTSSSGKRRWIASAAK